LKNRELALYLHPEIIIQIIMKVLKIEPGEGEPKVILDKENGIFEFSGKSFPEDVREFYNPILEWFEEYSKSTNPSTVVDFKLSYFNTASSKMLLDIFYKLEAIAQEDKEVKIRWYHLEDDDDMFEAGEEYSEMIDVPFEFISYE